MDSPYFNSPTNWFDGIYSVLLTSLVVSYDVGIRKFENIVTLFDDASAFHEQKILVSISFPSPPQ